MQEPYTIKVGEGITQDITLDDNVTTISLDDEKIGYAGELLSIEIVKKHAIPKHIPTVTCNS